jgi:hypothetical protein
LMNTIRIPRKKHETKEPTAAAQDEAGTRPEEIRAERAEEEEFESAREGEEVPEHYRTKIDKY